jgi:3-oxoacyl-[acyl-carrier protein] reductase
VSAGVAIVTGAGRRAGIGFAIAQRLLTDGLSVLIHSWGDDPAEVIAELGGIGPRLRHVEADFADPAAPRAVIDEAVRAFGRVDVLVANHARDSGYALEAVTAEELDITWAVNARAVVLLVQAFAAAASGTGRVVLFTSGQHLGSMASELPYAISKGAVHQMTRSLADALAGRGITVNAINPGPVDTGWPTPELREALLPQFPAGRWGRPEDIAPVVAWLASDAAAWVTGQVIDAEGGFRR